MQHSYPVLVQRRGQGRRLPPTPCKPSTLQLKPSNINFPKLNASPTHVSTVCFLADVYQRWEPSAFHANFILFLFSSLLFSLCSFIHRLIIRRHIVFIHCHILANSFETTRISTTGKKTGMRVENIFVIIADRLATLPEVVSVFLSRSSIISEWFYCYLLYEFWVESQNFSFHSTVEYDDSDYDMRYEYRDRERELYELERDREERELERER